MKHMAEIRHKKTNKRLMRTRLGARDTKRCTKSEDDGSGDVMLGTKQEGVVEIHLVSLETVVTRKIDWDDEPEYGYEDWQAFERELERISPLKRT